MKIAIVLVGLCTACSDISPPPTNKTQTIVVKAAAILGPISTGTVSIYRLSDLKKLHSEPIITKPFSYDMVNSDTNRLYQSAAVGDFEGELKIPENMPASTLLKITVTGGKDIDPNDDFFVDSEQIQSLNGELVAVTTWEELQTNKVVINALSTFAALSIQNISDSEKIQTQLNKIAQQFLSLDTLAGAKKGDVNTDGSVDFKDLARFDPSEQSYGKRKHDRYLANPALYVDLLPNPDQTSFIDAIYSNNKAAQLIILNSYFDQEHFLPFTVEALMEIAGDPEKTASLTFQNLNSIQGVSGAVETMFPLYQDVIAHSNGNDVDSIEKINQLIYLSNSLGQDLSVTDYETLGINVPEAQLSEFNTLLASKNVDDKNSLAKLREWLRYVSLPIVTLTGASTQKGKPLVFVLKTDQATANPSLHCATTSTDSAHILFTPAQTVITEFQDESATFKVQTLNDNSRKEISIKVQCDTPINVRFPNVTAQMISTTGNIRNLVYSPVPENLQLNETADYISSIKNDTLDIQGNISNHKLLIPYHATGTAQLLAFENKVTLHDASLSAEGESEVTFILSWNDMLLTGQGTFEAKLHVDDSRATGTNVHDQTYKPKQLASTDTITSLLTIPYPSDSNATPTYFTVQIAPGILSLQQDFLYSTKANNDSLWLSHNLGANYSDIHHEAFKHNEIPKTLDDENAYGQLFSWEEALTACPSGFHLPSKAEWEIEKSSWTETSRAGAFESNLRLSAAGYQKDNNSSISNQGKSGYYWSNDSHATDSSKASILYFSTTSARIYDRSKTYKYAVRCIQSN